MTSLAITAITNFILACEVFFLAGLLYNRKKAAFSAAWFWTTNYLLFGTAFFIGGIDHGFVEPLGQFARIPIMRLSYFLAGVVTFCTLMTTARQFLHSKLQTSILIIGIIQLALFTILIFVSDEYWIVMLNSVPILLLFLIFNFIGSKDGRGSWPMIAGVILQFLASGVQTIDMMILGLFDQNACYHIVLMISVVFLYVGGLRLRRDI